MRRLNGTDRSIVRLGKPDILLGRPLPWDVFDEDGVLLYAEGALIFSQRKLNSLLERGLYRKLRNIPPDLEKLKIEEALERKKYEKHLVEDNRPLEKIPLGIGDVLQLQPLHEIEGSKYFLARLVGFLVGESIVITTPVKDHKYIPLREGQSFVIRFFSGRSVYAFVAHVLKQSTLHYSYIHFSYPNIVKGIKRRSGVRARVNMIGYVKTAEGVETSVRVQDLSTGGCRLVGRELLGQVDSEILLKLRIKSHEMDEYISIRAVIRSFGMMGDENWIRHGVQFVDMDPEHKVALSAYVYRTLLDEDKPAGDKPS